MPVNFVSRMVWLPVNITSQTSSLWHRVAKAHVANTAVDNALSLVRRQIFLWQASHAHRTALPAVDLVTKNL